jgi:hypothetical protein
MMNFMKPPYEDEIMNALRTYIATLFTIVFSTCSLAGPVDLPNTFTAGTPARAAEVNANFNAVKTAVDDNATRIAQLEALLAAMGVTTGTDAQGNPVVIFSGVNVHINNGEGSTDTVNGLGNLVIGYDEVTSSASSVCSIGTYTNQPNCEANGGVWAASHKSGSHNIVTGSEHNYSQYGGLIAGLRNTVNSIYGSISGGEGNRASGNSSSVSGGFENLAFGIYSSISGGSSNLTNSQASSISGGFLNSASGLQSSVSGGNGNQASGQRSSVSGGSNNEAIGAQSSVSGGDSRDVLFTSDWAAGSLFQDN